MGRPLRMVITVFFEMFFISIFSISCIGIRYVIFLPVFLLIAYQQAGFCSGWSAWILPTCWRISDLNLSGMMRKVCNVQTLYFLLFWMLAASLCLFLHVYLWTWLASVMMMFMYVFWFLLNIKDRYFSFWKKDYKMIVLETLMCSSIQTQKETEPLRSSRNFEKNEYKLD